MFNWTNKKTYEITGTTPPIYVPHHSTPKSIQPGEGYFFIQIRAAQAAFSGPFWEKIKSLIVTSQVSLNHSILGSEALHAIQRSIAVERNRAEQLGMSPNLIRLVPATMAQVSISVDFILDKENQLSALGGLINNDAFFAAVSLAPGAAMVARTVSSLSQKILQTFIKSEERQPILQFSGDLNVVGGLKAGYYIILGTRDEDHPLPNPLPSLEVVDEGLLANGVRITQLSYIVFDVRCVSARTRDLNDGAVWDNKLSQAETIAMSMSGNPLVTEHERKQAWQACVGLLKEAQILLSTDPNYLNREAQNIIKTAFTSCSAQILATGPLTTRGVAGNVHSMPDALRPERQLLGIPVDEDLDETLDNYAEQVAETRRVLRAAGV
jgi:hypothetical protein